MNNKRHQNLQGYSFMMPALLAILFFTIVPVVYAFFLMFFKVDMLAGTRNFIGLDNFGKIFEDPKFWASFYNTFKYVLVVVPIQTIIALALAALLNNKVKFSRGFLTVMFIPTLTSSSAMTLIFMWLFNNNGLVVNTIDDLFGIRLEFLTDPSLALTVIMIMNIFSTVPHFMIVFLSGLQDIPDSLYEAASLDGASAFKQFRHVTVPQIMPITFYVVTMGLVGCFQIFDQAFIISNGTGGPQNSTLTFSLYIYQLAFNSNDMGRATALAFVLGAIIFTVTYIVNKLLKADEVNG
ncbi:carbohydrate ABC transporter permease [Mesobacillus stamsii]|uniref:ABC-type sugar transport system permease subunit n=1 Tax=Mesobacillus stamsii TaxID=225347 RepID=A0ABU0G0Q6_9BACI|nr:sugar ABC transporter permease [Mesobacillus stamsii]MDQ0415771.1 ABC-type sugar transport system permease subunit [Mesobacillus stamsii]